MNPVQQALTFVVILFSVGLLGVFVYKLAPVLTPFMIAAVLAYLSDPLVEKLSATKWKVPRTISVIFVFFVVALILIIVMFFLVPALQKQLVTLAAKLPAGIDWIQSVVMPELVALGILPQDLGLDTLKTSLSKHMNQAGEVAKWMWQTLFHSGMAILEWSMHLLIVVVATFYLLRDWRKILAAIESLLPTAYAPTIIQITKQCDVVLSTFVRGQLAVMVSLGFFYGLGLALIGLNYSLLLGMVAGILSIVPYLGSIVGLGAALAVAYFQFDTLWPVIGVLGLFGIGHILEGMVLTPLLIGDKLGLHPVAVIFAILAGGELLGFVGVVLALPLTAILVVIIRELLHKLPSSLPISSKSKPSHKGKPSGK
ncbi:MAG: AI-2E family transporter [Gammaproteobacteria bacterium]|jgi:predicted PurR-regulated permease PerM|nr:AI-2E family transporter [Gammaproteobacteria bacterium]